MWHKTKRQVELFEMHCFSMFINALSVIFLMKFVWLLWTSLLWLGLDDPLQLTPSYTSHKQKSFDFCPPYLNNYRCGTASSNCTNHKYWVNKRKYLLLLDQSRCRKYFLWTTWKPCGNADEGQQQDASQDALRVNAFSKGEKKGKFRCLIISLHSEKKECLGTFLQCLFLYIVLFALALM